MFPPDGQRRLDQAVRHHEQEEFEQAEAIYLELLDNYSRPSEVLFHLSRLATQAEVYTDAIDLLREALQKDPANEHCQLALADNLFLDGQFEKASTSYERLKGHGKIPVTAYLERLGTCLLKQQAHDAVRELCHLASHGGPLTRHNRLSLARLQVACGEADTARQTLEEVLKENPADLDALQALTKIYDSQKRFHGLIPFYAEFCSREPSHGEMRNTLTLLLFQSGQHERCLESLRQTISSRPWEPLVPSSLINLLTSSDQNKDEAIFEAAQKWDADFGRNPGLLPLEFNNERNPEKPLRIGIISRTFHEHATTTLMLPLVEQLHRRFTLHLYHDGPRCDATSDAFRQSSTKWTQTSTLTEFEAAQVIRDDEIDILVDISGHCDGGRLRILAHRPAPIQVHYYGGSSTTGLRSMDYRISDSIVEPDQLEAPSSERVLRLPHGFHLYRPLHQIENPPQTPESRNGYITFGSATGLHKISDTTMRLWGQVIREVPDSRLRIERDAFTHDPELTAFFRDRLIRCGVPEDQIELAGGDARHFQTLQPYRGFDIMLDAFPYCGVTTLCDALWMGVPVVSLQGTRFVSRIASSLLQRVELSDLVAQTEQQYIEIACELASDRTRRETLRQDLRQRMQASSLGDAEGLACEFEKQFRLIWAEWCQ